MFTTLATEKVTQSICNSCLATVLHQVDSYLTVVSTIATHASRLCDTLFTLV